MSTPAAATAGFPTPPPDDWGYQYINLQLMGCDEGYIHGAASFRAYGPCNVLCVSFHYRYDIPENAYLRVINRNGNSGNYGEGSLTRSEDGLLTGRIVMDTFSLVDLYDLRFACVDPGTGRILFECSLQGREHKKHPTPRPYPYPTPRPTDPPPPTVYTVPGTEPIPTPTPAAASTAVSRYTAPGTPAPMLPLPGEDEPYSSIKMEVKNKERKYSHYAAHLRVYDDCLAAVIYFRWHDPLPDGAYMQLVAVNDDDGSYGCGMIGPSTREDGPADLLQAAVVLSEAIPEAISNLQFACVNPQTGETIFTVRFGCRYSPRVYTTVNPNGTTYTYVDGVRVPSGSTHTTPSSPTYNNYTNNYGWNNNGGTSWIEDGMQIQVPSYGGWGW